MEPERDKPHTIVETTITPSQRAEKIIPRGVRAMLPHGGLPESVSLYLLELIEKTGGRKGPLGLQFLAQPELEKKYYQIKALDPLIEDEHEVAPGLVYKYRGKLNKNKHVVTHGRVLWTITRFCSTYCRFCTRGREVGIPPNVKGYNHSTISRKPYLDDNEIEQVFNFLRDRKEINEVILSGGDPLTCPQNYLTKVFEGLSKLQKEGHIDIIRLGTRLPVHNPPAVQNWHYELLRLIQNPYLMVHINHPFELTPQTLNVLNNFRRIAQAVVMSQSVLLKGINDNVQTLHDLFVKMAAEGIRPYYIYQNDPVYWASHFTVPPKRAIKIWQSLRPKLSGVAATARLVIDTPFGFGKVAVPEGNAWEVNFKSYKDFKGQRHELARK
ncbi:MAG: radical SAM protein [Patescibacteria group bacterium]|nr:radical SAM protein [Patescibacteria group bacterium]